MTTHIVVENNINTKQIIAVKKEVKEIIDPFKLEHSTIEIETEDEFCRFREN